ncbi:potassium-transporting ATPase subunit KdpA [Ktedonosporobacter rubrisoli]|uniref:Potassium-transporting ATPase potassium-binding subunit n=1 Tax=Ktedonosporobacter rubrisoli TaxID=2509675 RepID=A0A4P6JSK7_KTERU|nr:potassium-transporting ATPase subunit KdpA [Ktedonosporobacter rubrisoli]QBD78538.1 potassium-transporting ATPase subunit KdpA [Ktedonosporobacter rubrisoli]
MSLTAIALYTLFLLIILVLVKPLGGYLACVFAGQKTWLDPALRPVERGIYALCRIDAEHEMTAKEYAISFVFFSLAGTLLLYALLRLQQFLPFYDSAHQVTPLTPDLAMNTAISFATTTTWQAYAGETTMSYTSQLVGLVAQNFLAGAAGLAVGIAFIRGFARQHTRTLGNFWVDLVRGLLWVLLPASILVSLVLVWQGVPMNFNPDTRVYPLEGGMQIIAQGPVAALESIKNLGTNGGRFFNVNGAHPYENPTWFSNLVEMLSIAVIPAALTNTFGRMVGKPRQGWLLLWVMIFLFILALGLGTWAEQSGNPKLATVIGTSQPNMEGKEVRFGVSGSILTAVTTSNGATGSTNSAHDSYTPLGGTVPLVNMLLGEMVFGGLGTGIYSILMIALLGLFLTGLMIGRTPEYLGKRIEPPEMKLLAIYTLIGPFGILVLTAVAIATGPGLAGLTTNSGSHGLTEVLYAYTSSFANNGQAFAGLSANSLFYNSTTAIAMLLGRFGLAIPALAFAGLFAQQTSRPMTQGKLKTDSPLFASVIIATTLIVVALTYLPVMALGPIIEHLLL